MVISIRVEGETAAVLFNPSPKEVARVKALVKERYPGKVTTKEYLFEKGERKGGRE